VPTWTKKFDDWHARVLEQAAILSMDLRHALDPVDKIAAESNEQIAVVDAYHEKKCFRDVRNTLSALRIPEQVVCVTNRRTVAVLSTIPERRGRLAGEGGDAPRGFLLISS
jgi:hypothetical protein